MRTVPELGDRMHPRIDSNVVLPLPEGPIRSGGTPSSGRTRHKAVLEVHKIIKHAVTFL